MAHLLLRGRPALFPERAQCWAKGLLDPVQMKKVVSIPPTRAVAYLEAESPVPEPVPSMLFNIATGSYG
jgi:hypothetical protein